MDPKKFQDIKNVFEQTKMEIHFGHKLLYFSQMVYKWPWQLFLQLWNDIDKSPIFKISHLGTKVTIFKIWLPSRLFFLYITQMLHKWPWQGLLGLPNDFEKISKFRIRHLNARVTNFNFWVPSSSLKISFIFFKSCPNFPVSAQNHHP